MKINLKEELEAGAKAYDKLLENDWRLRLEEEAKERLFQEKQAVKRKKNAEEEAEKKKQKKRRGVSPLKRKVRAWRL